MRELISFSDINSMNFSEGVKKYCKNLFFKEIYYELFITQY